MQGTGRQTPALAACLKLSERTSGERLSLWGEDKGHRKTNQVLLTGETKPKDGLEQSLPPHTLLLPSTPSLASFFPSCCFLFLPFPSFWLLHFLKTIGRLRHFISPGLKTVQPGPWGGGGGYGGTNAWFRSLPAKCFRGREF